MSDKRYAIVTCISQFRQRYCVPVDELQKMNPDVNIMDSPAVQVHWADDLVTCEEVKEFSQHWIGEQIVDTFIVDEPRALLMFDRDNDYLASWTKEKKLEWINNWEADYKDPPAMYEKSTTPESSDTNYVKESNLTSQKMNDDQE